MSRRKPKSEKEEFNRAVDRWRPVADRMFAEKLRGISTKEAGAFAVACLEQCAEVFCFLDQSKGFYLNFAGDAFDFSQAHVAEVKSLQKAMEVTGAIMPVNKVGQA